MDTTVKIDARDVNFWYGDFHALKGISMQIEEKEYDTELLARGIKKERIRHYGFAFRGKKVLIGTEE